MIYNPAQLPAVADIAVRTAYARRGVGYLTLPYNPIREGQAWGWGWGWGCGPRTPGPIATADDGACLARA